MKQQYNRKLLTVSDKLMAKVAQYDVRAFEELYNQTSGAVFGLAMSLLKHQQDAEDVVQNTYITIYEKIEQYHPNKKAMAWIFTIARNHALMLLRQRSKNQHVDLDDVYDIGEEPTVEEDMYKEELVDTLLEHLNEEERQIVVMHAMSNLKHKEIATILDIPLSTVLSKYRRAIQKLRKVMEVNGYE
jgi:RNA polymerase sigma-70 factor (ECF subfamily)